VFLDQCDGRRPRLVRELEGLLRREAGLEFVVPGHRKVLTRADLSSFCRSVADRYGEVKPERSAAGIISQTIEREGIEAALRRCPPPDPDDEGCSIGPKGSSARWVSG